MIIDKKRYEGLEVFKHRGIPLYSMQRTTHGDGGLFYVESVFPLQSWMYEDGVPDPTELLNRSRVNPCSIGMYGFWGHDNTHTRGDAWYSLSWAKVPAGWRAALIPQICTLYSPDERAPFREDLPDG